MTQLRMCNARGAMPESLTGSFYRLLNNGVPHQMFSELNAMPALVEGVLGLDLDVPHNRVRLAPHLPPAWPEISVRQFPESFPSGRLHLWGDCRLCVVGEAAQLLALAAGEAAGIARSTFDY